MTTRLKTRMIKAMAGQGAYIGTLVHGSIYADRELALTFYDEDGRCIVVRLTDAQVVQIARTAIRGYGRTASSFPTLADIEDTKKETE